MKKKSFSKKDPAQEATRLGEEAAQKENYKKAKDYFNQALKHDPQYEPAFINLASIAIKEGTTNVASKYFETIANLAIEKHLYVKSIAALKRALQYDPINKTAQERLINILRTQYDPKLVQACHAEQPHHFEEDDQSSDEVISTDPPVTSIPPENDGEFNLADLLEEDIDLIAEVEVLISEGAFEEAYKLLSPLNLKYSSNKYIKLLVGQIESRDVSVKSFIPTDSKEPEIDLSVAI